MLVLHVQLEMFFRESFKTAYDTRKHGDCRFVLLAMMRCMSNVIIFPYQKENILCRKWYVLNLVCFGSGTATFDERGTIESEIEERCWKAVNDNRETGYSNVLAMNGPG